ncbi:MAG: hypothetical protein ABI557_05705, partial [Aureliella sp.]
MSHCCLCGLLCSLDCGATEAASSEYESQAALRPTINIEDCHRRNQWLAQTHSSKSSTFDRSTIAASLSTEKLSAQVEAIATLFKPMQRSLI